MRQELDNKLNNEITHFMAKLEGGFDPITAFTAILPRILKEQDRDTRHNCAEAVLQAKDGNEAHNICMNVNSFIVAHKPKMK